MGESYLQSCIFVKHGLYIIQIKNAVSQTKHNKYRVSLQMLVGPSYSIYLVVTTSREPLVILLQYNTQRKFSA
jgi:hypothetical protein